jgi:hypothetical protein
VVAVVVDVVAVGVAVVAVVVDSVELADVDVMTEAERSNH